METPYELFGIECGEGWKEALKPIFAYIEEYNKNNEEKIEIHQIKEKFGGLRCYCNFVTNELNEIIRNAEYECSNTCELCGSKENVGTTLGWITTCCEDCVKKMSEQRPSNIYRWKPYKCDDNIKWFEYKNGEKTITYKV